MAASEFLPTHMPPSKRIRKLYICAVLNEDITRRVAPIVSLPASLRVPIRPGYSLRTYYFSSAAFVAYLRGIPIRLPILIGLSDDMLTRRKRDLVSFRDNGGDADIRDNWKLCS